jgi:hypothetical protein
MMEGIHQIAHRLPMELLFMAFHCLNGHRALLIIFSIWEAFLCLRCIQVGVVAVYFVLCREVKLLLCVPKNKKIIWEALMHEHAKMPFICYNFLMK